MTAKLRQLLAEGTTGRAARKHGRSFIGADINEDYCAMAARRLQQLALPLADPAGLTLGGQL